ncbi:hypothetical protein [Chitinilyticum aquatile]|uniref:hypothetical protein n=1 Tax=Chitinilyticum aquatile TaxID=362520 RepID=UPI0012DEA7DA|nr:hypothetical protein [Chitinilyticum aquatile]
MRKVKTNAAKAVGLMILLLFMGYFIYGNMRPQYTQKAVIVSIINYAIQNKAVLSERPSGSVKLLKSPDDFVDVGYVFNRSAVFRNDEYNVSVVFFIDGDNGMHCFILSRDDGADLCQAIKK